MHFAFALPVATPAGVSLSVNSYCTTHDVVTRKKDHTSIWAHYLRVNSY